MQYDSFIWVDTHGTNAEISRQDFTTISTILALGESLCRKAVWYSFSVAIIHWFHFFGYDRVPDMILHKYM